MTVEVVAAVADGAEVVVSVAFGLTVSRAMEVIVWLAVDVKHDVSVWLLVDVNCGVFVRLVVDEKVSSGSVVEVDDADADGGKRGVWLVVSVEVVVDVDDAFALGVVVEAAVGVRLGRDVEVAVWLLLVASVPVALAVAVGVPESNVRGAAFAWLQPS